MNPSQWDQTRLICFEGYFVSLEIKFYPLSFLYCTEKQVFRPLLFLFFVFWHEEPDVYRLRCACRGGLLWIFSLMCRYRGTKVIPKVLN